MLGRFVGSCLVVVCLSVSAGGFRFDPLGAWGSGNYRHVAMVGSLALCSAGFGGVDIFEISPSGIPSFRVHWAVPNAQRIVLAEEVGYLIDGDWGLVVFRLDENEEPVRLGSFDWGFRFLDQDIDMALDGDFLYVSGDSTGIWRFDVSDPAKPDGEMIVGNLFYSFRAVSAENNHIWAITTDGLALFDTDAPEPQLPVAERQGSFFDLERIGPNLLVSGIDGLVIVRGDDLETLGTLETKPSGSLAVSEGRAYASVENGFQVLDIENPALPVLLGTVTVTGPLSSLTLSGDHLLVSRDEDGLAVFGFGGLLPTLVGTYDRSGYAGEVIVEGEVAFLNHLSSLEILDVGDPSSPRVIDSIPFGSHIRDIHLDQNRLFVCEAFAGLHLYDVSNPASPVRLSTVPGNPDAVIALGDRAHLSDGALMEIDLSDPTEPKVIAGIGKTSRYLYLAREEDRLYIGDVQGSLAMVDVSEPGFPRITGFVDVPTGPMVARENVLYVAGWGVLSAVDVSNPEEAIPIGRAETQTIGLHIALAGQSCFVTTGDGVEGFDVSEPGSPRRNIFYQGLDPTSVSVSRSRLFVSEGFGGRLSSHRLASLEARAVIPWNVANAGFQSRISLFNRADEALGIHLTAVATTGETREAMAIVEEGAVAALEVGELFPEFSGYSLTIAPADERVWASTLLFNIEEISGGNSPAQTNAQPIDELEDGLVFPYVSGLDTAALVIAAPESTATTSVIVTLRDDRGRNRETELTLRANRPVAVLVSDLFGNLPDHAAIWARSINGQKLAGINFTFNQSRQPSMAAAIPSGR